MGIVVVGEPFRKNKRLYVTAKCECGKVFEIQKRRIGVTNTCGCFKYRHGHCEKKPSPEYRVWCGMMARCENEGGKDFHRYGARGVRVCDRWKDFANFIADMGPRPKGTSIDRIDNSKGYEPGNCRWADEKTQQRNKTTVHWVEFRGEKISLPELAERFGLKNDTLYQRYVAGWDLEKAVTKPPRSQVKRYVTIDGETKLLNHWCKAAGVKASSAYYDIYVKGLDPKTVFFGEATNENRIGDLRT